MGRDPLGDHDPMDDDGVDPEEDPVQGPDEVPEQDPDRDSDEGFVEPLPPEERESVEADLHDLEAMQVVFEAQGAKGVVIACTECGSNHYYGWELLRESLEHMLSTGEPRMHEPAYQPREDDYVIWDYGKGYVDALSDAGLAQASKIELSSCAWCETPVEPHFAFCPQCGRPMAVVRLFRELIDRGMDDSDVRTLLLQAGFETFGQP